MANQRAVLNDGPTTSSPGPLASSKANGGGKPQKNGKAAISAIAWRAHRELSFAEWVEQGRRLGIIGRSAAWWIGDWLNWGNAAYGERYVRAARITGYDPQTLMNMSYVASHFDVSRRRENLSWSHHAELAAADAEEQERWLDRAQDDRLSVRCLREAIRRERLLKDGERAQLESADQKTAGSRHGGDEKTRGVCPQCGFRLAESDAAA